MTTPELLVDPAFGRALRDLRRRRGMTGRELAADIAVSQATLSGLENGSRRPSLPMVEHLDRVLDAGGTLRALVHPAREPGDDGGDADRVQHALRYPSRGVDGPAVDALAGVLAAHRRLDDVVDAGALLPIAGPHHDLVVQLARDVRGPHATAARLVAAESLQFAGWLNAQVGRHRVADRLYDSSVRRSLDVGAPGLASQSSRFRGSLALETGHHGAAVRHYTTAASIPGVGPLHTADATLRAAHGHALMGNRAGALASLRAASTSTDDGADVEPEPFAYWMSADWLRFPVGLAFLELGELDRAADQLRAGLDALPGSWRAASWTRPYSVALERAESGSPEPES